MTKRINTLLIRIFFCIPDKLDEHIQLVLGRGAMNALLWLVPCIFLSILGAIIALLMGANPTAIILAILLVNVLAIQIIQLVGLVPAMHEGIYVTHDATSEEVHAYRRMNILNTLECFLFLTTTWQLWFTLICLFDGPINLRATFFSWTVLKQTLTFSIPMALIGGTGSWITLLVIEKKRAHRNELD